mmetsp:Transcript_24967/g.56917  ORF Transcript_24967/g.56917 Transcript_24967/m.56917 type:complete len:221 (+) Transcript_24967:665-1327(+)
MLLWNRGRSSSIGRRSCSRVVARTGNRERGKLGPRKRRGAARSFGSSRTLSTLRWSRGARRARLPEAQPPWAPAILNSRALAPHGAAARRLSVWQCRPSCSSGRSLERARRPCSNARARRPVGQGAALRARGHLKGSAISSPTCSMATRRRKPQRRQWRRGWKALPRSWGSWKRTMGRREGTRRGLGPWMRCGGTATCEKHRLCWGVRRGADLTQRSSRG